jgi:hypothetical protein
MTLCKVGNLSQCAIATHAGRSLYAIPLIMPWHEFTVREAAAATCAFIHVRTPY